MKRQVLDKSPKIRVDDQQQHSDAVSLAISLRVPVSVVERCNATGSGWQTRMLRTLESERRKPPN